MSAPGADEGWTHVGRKSKRGPRRVGLSTEDVTETTEVAPNPNPTFTVEDIRKYHEAICAEWEASECCNILKNRVAENSKGRPAIARAVCLGAGSFDPANGSWAARRAAHMQVAAFKTLVSALNASCDNQVIQEPALTPADKAFCAELDLEVAENSDAFAMVDGETLVFGIHLYIRTWHDALRTLPAVFVGTGLESWEHMISFKPELGPLLEPIAEMHASYDLYPFPNLGHIFTGTVIYWKKEPVSKTDEPPA